MIIIYDNNILNPVSDTITVYEHYDYQGAYSNLKVGFYNISQMGIANDKSTSRIKSYFI